MRDSGVMFAQPSGLPVLAWDDLVACPFPNWRLALAKLSPSTEYGLGKSLHFLLLSLMMDPRRMSKRLANKRIVPTIESSSSHAIPL
ncbi:unnamed protein product [Dibothriocephalus latus]|uniref:Uncharacterized protein n=1 Tax=Dibothriocephalus latus TaxID=60516 RepID=A0A3P6VH99_DIBLA|nr:unnamed protein product [Dibothriocephalus latus]